MSAMSNTPVDQHDSETLALEIPRWRDIDPSVCQAMEAEWRISHQGIVIYESQEKVIAFTSDLRKIAEETRTALTTLRDATIFDAIEWIRSTVNDRVSAPANAIRQNTEEDFEIELSDWAGDLADLLEDHPFSLESVLKWVVGLDESDVGEVWLRLSPWTQLVICPDIA